MTCPNENSQEFKDLVAKVGKTEAYLMFIDNDFKQPSEKANFEKRLYPKVNSDEERLLNKIMEANNLKGKILQSLSLKFQMIDKGSKKSGKDKKRSLKEIREQVKLITDEESKEGLMQFVVNSAKSIDYWNEQLFKAESIDSLKKLEGFVGAYDVLEDVNNYVRKYTDNSESETIQRALSKLKNFRENYLDISENLIIDKLSNYSDIIRENYRDKFNREYIRSNPIKDGESKEDYRERKKEFIEKNLKENENLINSQEKEYLKNSILLAPRDIGTLTSLFMDPRGVNDHLIQVTAKLLDVQDFKTKETFIKDRKKYYEKFSEILEEIKRNDSNVSNLSYSKNNMSRLYGDIVEKDEKGKPTGFVTSKIHSNYFKEKRKAESLSRQEGNTKAIDQFRKENLKNPKVSDRNPENIKDKWLNKQWPKLKEDKSRFKMRDLLFNLSMTSDDYIKSSGLKMNGDVFKIPAVTNSFSENVEENGLAYAIKRNWSESFFIQNDDYDFGDLSNLSEKERKEKIKVIGDEKGNKLNSISLPFRAEMTDTKDLSLDLFGSFMTNHFVSINYSNKSLIKNDLLLVQQLLEERGRFQSTLGDKTYYQSIKDVLGVGIEEERKVIKETSQSNRLKLYQSLIEDRLIGIGRVYGGTTFFGVSKDKLADTAMAISARNFLGFNYLGNSANLLQGKVMNLLEGEKGKWFNKRDLLTAESIYLNDWNSIIKDIGSYVPKSLTNILIEKFIDTSMDFSGFTNNVMANKKMRRMTDEGYGNSLNASAEHYIQSTLMYAHLNSIKMKNKNGDYVNEDGNVVEKKDALSLAKAYELKDGQAVFNNDFYPDGMEEMNLLEIESEISFRIKDIIADDHGNHDPRNKSQIQRRWYGVLFNFMRKWVIRTTLSRYRGISGSLKKYEDLSIEDKNFSVAKGSFQEGTYTSFVRFGYQQMKNVKSLQFDLLTRDWKTLTEEEAGNIRAVVLELGILAASWASSTLLYLLAQKAKDEDEEELEALIYNFAYLSERLQGELTFYYPIVNWRDVKRIAKDPSPVINTLSLIMEVLEQMIPVGFDYEDGFKVISPWTEEYKTGKRKGKNKLMEKSMKLFISPYKNVIDATAKEKFNYLKNAK